MPCGTRRGGVNFGSGFAGSGAQSLRASETSTKPARSVSDGWPVKLVIVSCSSRSDGTISRSTSLKMRAISSATLRRSRSACTQSTAERNRASRNRFGHASFTCTLSVPSWLLSGEVLERRRALREQDRHQRAVRPVGQRHFLQLHPELLHRLHRRAIDVGRGSFLHPLRDVADLESGDGRGGVEVEPARHARRIAGVRTADRLQHEHRVFDRPRHRTELVERPAQRHRAGARARGRTSDADR